MISVLVIDDSRSVQAMVKKYFENKKITMQQVFNGKEGTQVLVSKKDFDLILLDWEMPEMTGPQTLQWIRSQGIDIPVIMMTTRNSVEDITYMMNLGASEYIMKPFTSDIIFQKIEMVLARDVENAA